MTFQAFSESIFRQSNGPTAAWCLMTFMAVTQGWDKCAGMAASYVTSLKSPSQHFNLMSSMWRCRIQNTAGGRMRDIFNPNVTFEYFSILPMFTFDKLIIIMLILSGWKHTAPFAKFNWSKVIKSRCRWMEVLLHCRGNQAPKCDCFVRCCWSIINPPSTPAPHRLMGSLTRD